MKVFLSLAIPAWIGMALGAIFEGNISNYWPLWAISGLLLFTATALYIDKTNNE